MAAIVTDQFRILNASNFVDSVADSNNSYYVFVGLPNPTQVGFGRTTDWNTNVLDPVDNFNYANHSTDTMLFGKKVTISNVKSAMITQLPSSIPLPLIQLLLFHLQIGKLAQEDHHISLPISL